MKIEVRFKEDKDKIYIVFVNNAKPFNPLLVNPTKYEKYDDDIAPGGLGLLIVKEMADHIEYKYENKHNRLSITIDKNKK